MELSSLYLKSGLKNVGIVFLMTDAQVPSESFLVLINDMLSTGEIPELFPDDEVDNIIAGVRNEVRFNDFMPLNVTLLIFVSFLLRYSYMYLEFQYFSIIMKYFGNIHIRVIKKLINFYTMYTGRPTSAQQKVLEPLKKNTETCSKLWLYKKLTWIMDILPKKSIVINRFVKALAALSSLKKILKKCLYKLSNLIAGYNYSQLH